MRLLKYGARDALVVAFALSSACWLPACGDDSAADSDNRGGAAGSAAGASMGGSGGGLLSRASCSAYCEHYVDVCAKPSVCKEYCDLVEQAAPARCAPEYNAYFECSATAEIDCSQALGNTPADACGRAEVFPVWRRARLRPFFTLTPQGLGRECKADSFGFDVSTFGGTTAPDGTRDRQLQNLLRRRVAKGQVRPIDLDQ